MRTLKAPNTTSARGPSFWQATTYAGILLLVLAGCGKDAEIVSIPPPVVIVDTVRKADVPVYDQWVGTLDGYVNANVRAQVSGVLLSQAYKDGSYVKKGDLLFAIDPRPFTAAWEQAKGQLAEAEARLGKAELDVQRYQPLAETGAISQQELDDARQSLQAAEAAIVSARAAVDAAKINLDFTQIHSPIDGLAGIAVAQVGDLVGPSTGTLTSISTLDPIKAYFYVSEQDYLLAAETILERKKNGTDTSPVLQLELILSDGKTYKHTGAVTAVDRQIDVRTGSIQLVGTFENPDHLLRPGQFVRVRGKINELKDVLVVPERAISELQGGFQVAIVDDSSQVQMVPVTLGVRDGNERVILSGVKEGDRIVVEGLQKIRSGILVNPMTAEQAKAALEAEKKKRQQAGSDAKADSPEQPKSR